MFRPSKIISGGQTGADQGGLFGAELCGIETGGWAPKGYRTEDGKDTSLLRDRFGLKEHSDWKYPPRTEQNVIDSDMTIIFAENINSVGTRLTISLCDRHDKPYYLFDMYCSSVEDLIEYVNKIKPGVINVAGNRESVADGMCKAVEGIITELFVE